MADAQRRHFNRPDVWESYLTDIQEERARSTASLLPGTGMTVLDVGAGSGIVGRALVEAGHSVVSVDSAVVPLGDAPGKRIASDARALPMIDRCVDASTACELMEHLDDRARNLTSLEIQRVTRSWIVATVPYRERYISSLVRCSRCKRVFHPNFHATSFDSVSFGGLFEPEFRIQRIELLGPPWPYVPAFLSSACHHLGIYRGAPPTSTCPGCGYARDPAGATSAAAQSWTRKLAKRIAPKNKATWYAGLFARRA